MNKKGQALIEFVLILPVLLLLILSFFDVANIILCKETLENRIDDVSTLILNEKEDEINSLLNKTNYNIKYSYTKDNYLNIKLETKLDLITPGLKNILSNPYKVVVERSVLYE